MCILVDGGVRGWNRYLGREGVVRFGGSNRLKLEADDIDLTGDGNGDGDGRIILGGCKR